MKELVVYESMFGNTRQIAEAIAAGLAESADVAAIEVSDTTAEAAEAADLLVAGGPTHAFSMSRPSTRSDAVNRGASEGRDGIGLREWLDALPARHGPMLATFDTRVAKMRHWPGSAAKAAAKVGRHDGYELAAPPMSFYVDDVDGPLLDGELDRATTWGRQLAASCRGRTRAS